MVREGQVIWMKSRSESRKEVDFSNSTVSTRASDDAERSLSTNEIATDYQESRLRSRNEESPISSNNKETVRARLQEGRRVV